MDGIAAVTARIGEIQGLMASLAPPPPVRATPAATPRADFATTLQQATAAGPGTAPAPTASLATSPFAPTTAAPLAPASALLGRAPASLAQAPAPLVQAPAALAPASAVAPAAAARTANGAPAALAAYGNGKIPASALTPIGTGDHRLWAPAAQAFTALEQAAARDGVKVKVTDSYRSYESQVDVARRKGLYSEGGLAAKPGTSEHGWGLSVDLSLDAKAQAWMRTNAARFGFEENVPREPWHWTYTSGR